MKRLRAPRRRSSAAFTLIEVLAAAAMTAVLLACVIFGMVALQQSYAATEGYASGQSDQARLLDYLALDLRRGVQLDGSTVCYTADPDGQGLKINVPDLYTFAASDPQHLYPILARPVYDATSQTAYYDGSGATVPAGGPAPYQVIVYRFNPADGSITRSDPWQPLVAGKGNNYSAAPPVVIATNMDAFPTITPDPADLSGNIVHYSVSFSANFRPPATTDYGTKVTLHNVTFTRSKNLAH